jgi:hypothetical protein
MDVANDSIQDQGYFGFLRANIGTIALAITVSITSGILALGETIMAPFRAIGRGLGRVLEGTFFAGTDVIEAGSENAVRSLLEGTASLLGPATFPIAVLTVVVGIAILVRGYQWFSPADWLPFTRRGD